MRGNVKGKRKDSHDFQALERSCTNNKKVDQKIKKGFI